MTYSNKKHNKTTQINPTQTQHLLSQSSGGEADNESIRKLKSKEKDYKTIQHWRKTRDSA